MIPSYSTDFKFMLRIFEAKDLAIAKIALSREEMSEFFSEDSTVVISASNYSDHVY